VSSDLPLSRQLLAHLGRGAADDELEAALASVLERSRRAWPTLTVDDDAFIEDLAARLSASERIADAVRQICAEDLYLACACRRRDPKALEEFERRVLPEARAALLSRRETREATEEALQVLRQRLFVDGEAAAKIGEYSGRGPLIAFVRMAAVRVWLNSKRGRAQAPADELDSRLAAPATPPELSYIKARYRDDFKAAFETAFATLSPRERTLLRLNLLDGLSTSKLARVYRADASTVRRWLADARKRLLDETRKALAARLHASERELESMMGLLVTQLEESVRRIFSQGRGAGSTPDGQDDGTSRP
jgi:RNA polymerase sigma-70 factor (ECF subfamily)